MKIVFVAPRSWPAHGGMEAYLRDLTRALSKQHEVVVIAQGLDTPDRGRLGDSLAPPPVFAPFQDGPVRIVQLRLSIARRLLLAPFAAFVTPVLRRYAWGRARIPATSLFVRVTAKQIVDLAHGADMVHVWGGGMLAAASIRAARQLDVPVAMTPFIHPGQWGDDPASQRNFHAADRILALLEVEAGAYRKIGVSTNRIDVLGICSPGVEGGRGQALRERLGISGPIVLFLGVRRRYKGVQLLLDATAILAASRPDVTVVFAGPGPSVAAEGDARIFDAGEVDDDGRAAWIDAADLLCLPSEGEIFPCTFLEAWSVGTPVLGSNIPTLTELIEGAGGGLTSPQTAEALAATLADALADPERLRAFGESGRRFWLEGHTPEASAVRHERIYESLRSEGAHA